jgi:hypothetical protein
MNNDDLNVTAIALAPTLYQVECSSCGTVTFVSRVFLDQIAMSHLAGHGIRVPALYLPSRN